LVLWLASSVENFRIDSALYRMLEYIVRDVRPKAPGVENNNPKPSPAKVKPVDVLPVTADAMTHTCSDWRQNSSKPATATVKSAVFSRRHPASAGISPGKTSICRMQGRRNLRRIPNTADERLPAEGLSTTPDSAPSSSSYGHMGF
jgi:hypothetical protein